VLAARQKELNNLFYSVKSMKTSFPIVQALAIIALVVAVLLAGYILYSQSLAESKAASFESKLKALEDKNKQANAQIEQLQLQVGAYKSISDCKEKALVDFIDETSGVVKTTLKDEFDRCDSVFSTLKAFAEKPA